MSTVNELLAERQRIEAEIEAARKREASEYVQVPLTPDTCPELKWVDDEHFLYSKYVHGSNDEFDWFELDDYGRPKFTDEFHRAWHYAFDEFQLTAKVNARTGRAEIVEIDGRKITY